MKNIIFVFCISLTFKTQLFPQDYLIFGTGASLTFYNSDELDSFKQTYNLVYGQNLAELLNGFGGAEGLRFEAGYRHMSRFDTAVLIGWQRFIRKDNARFTNQENRLLELKTDVFYLENELGRAWGDFFVNGLFTLFFERDLTIKAEYFGATGGELARRLNGSYESNTSLSGDFGVAVGIYRKPFFLIGKITYPLFATNKSDLLQDDNQEKAADGTDVFPDDYIKFLDREPYDGVTNKIDGLKVSVTVSFAVRL